MEKLGFISHDNWRGFHPAPKLLPQSSLCEELAVPGVCSSPASQSSADETVTPKSILPTHLERRQWNFNFKASWELFWILLCFVTMVLKVFPEQSSLQVSEEWIWRWKLESYLTFAIIPCLTIKMKKVMSNLGYCCIFERRFSCYPKVNLICSNIDMGVFHWTLPPLHALVGQYFAH